MIRRVVIAPPGQRWRADAETRQGRRAGGEGRGTPSRTKGSRPESDLLRRCRADFPYPTSPALPTATADPKKRHSRLRWSAAALTVAERVDWATVTGTAPAGGRGGAPGRPRRRCRRR